MWLTAPNRLGIAAWQSGDSLWRIAADGGAPGVSLAVATDSIALVGDGQNALPGLQEQYVRGDELHLSFPQSGADAEFGLRLAIRPLPEIGLGCGPQFAAFEWLVSIQTNLLDAHPAVRFQLLDAGSARVIAIPESGCCAMTVHGDDFSAAVVLGPQDAASLQDKDAADDRAVKFFGDFLEKGVIRRARPWFLINRSQGGIDDQWLSAAADLLINSPLPLD